MITSQQFQERGGGVCPYCEKSDIVYIGCPTSQGRRIQWESLCLDCRAMWDEYYAVVGYTAVRPPQ